MIMWLPTKFYCQYFIGWKEHPLRADDVLTGALHPRFMLGIMALWFLSVPPLL